MKNPNKDVNNISSEAESILSKNKRKIMSQRIKESKHFNSFNEKKIAKNDFNYLEINNSTLTDISYDEKNQNESDSNSNSIPISNINIIENSCFSDNTKDSNSQTILKLLKDEESVIQNTISDSTNKIYFEYNDDIYNNKYEFLSVNDYNLEFLTYLHNKIREDIYEAMEFKDI